MDKKINDHLARLTEEQTAEVAGGMPPRGGCPSCTSGRAFEFQEEVARLAK